MAPKHPRLEHVRYVRAKGKTYAYFNTGKKKPDGRPIYAPLPPPDSVGFLDSWAAMKGARTKRNKVEYTLADLVRDYELSPTYGGLKRNTQILYTKTLIRISQLLGKFPLHDLKRSDVQVVLDKSMAGPGAYNIFLVVLRIICKWAEERGKVTQKPANDIRRLKTGEHQPWPEPVLTAALQSDDDLVRLSVSLLYFTGQRIGDVCKMRWSDIRDGMIEVVQQKTDKLLWIQILDDLSAELARTPKRGLTILAGRDGRPVTDEMIRKRLQAFTLSMGVKTVPHGLRKNAVIAFLEAGCSLAEVASISGQTHKMVEYYAKRINQRNLAKAAVLKLETKRGLRKRGENHG
jgi:integrase